MGIIEARIWLSLIKSCLLLALIFIVVGNLQAQTFIDTNKEKLGVTIKAYPLQLLNTELRFSFEKPITAKTSIDVGAGYLWERSNGVVYPGLPIGEGLYFYPQGYVTGFDVLVDGRYYFSNNVNKSRTYICPLILYAYYSCPSVYDWFYNIAGQLLIGRKFQTSTNFSFEIYGGIGIYRVHEVMREFGSLSITPNPVITDTYSMPTFNCGVTLNFSFKKNKK